MPRARAADGRHWLARPQLRSHRNR